MSKFQQGSSSPEPSKPSDEIADKAAAKALKKIVENMRKK